MNISIIHPTRHRIEQALATREKWLLRADNSLEYIFSFDTDDDTIPGYIQGLRAPNMTAIEAINYGASTATGDLLIVVSDDFDCPEHWDTLLLNELEGKTDFLLKTDDAYQPTLVTLPIMDRTYYNRFGYIYHPGYKHMFCDQEMTAVAIMTGKYLKSPLVFPHNHYTTGKTPKDEINTKNDTTWEQGEKLYNGRLKINFDIVKPIVAYSDIKWQ